MKKILKSCLLVLVAVCVGFSVTACKKKVSSITVNTDNVKTLNGKTTNGGMTAVYGDYLYFINGTKDNDGTNLTGNTRGAICRVKYNAETGETTGDKEVVISDLAGIDDGSINIFGDFLYYVAPCTDKNSKAEVLYNKLSFKRYDLVNEASYTIYSTQQNSSDEDVDYAYYVVNDSLNLLVYETENATITSLKVDEKTTTNYVIENVTGCLFSENYGTVTTTGATVDANSFIYYTKDAETGDAVQTGCKVYKSSPVQNNSALISSGKSITLHSIRAGKLLYTYEDAVYAQAITASATETLATSNTNCVSRENLESAIYIENYKLTGKNETAKLVACQGAITVLYFDEDSTTISIFQWQDSIVSDIDEVLNHTTIAEISGSTSFEFIGLTKLEEIVTEDDEDTPDVNEEVKRTVLYAVYTESSLVYKIEIAVVDGDDLKVSQHAEAIKLSTTTVAETSGLLLPEIVGDYLFILAEESDENEYLYKIDVTSTETASDEAEIFAITE